MPDAGLRARPALHGLRRAATSPRTAARSTVSHDIESAYRGADVVYAKSWGALPYFGNWDQEKPIREKYKHFIVDEAKMALTDNGVFSHCLPLRRNVKATDAVMDSPAVHRDRRGREPPACAEGDHGDVWPADRGLESGSDANSRRGHHFVPQLRTNSEYQELRQAQPSSAHRALSPSSKDIVLAFSGGLDTSFCVPYLKERGWAVHTVFADTGGVDARGARLHRERARTNSASPATSRSTAGRRSGTASSSRSSGPARATRASIRCWFPTAT